MKHLMVDIETLGLAPDAVLMSIGAAPLCTVDWKPPTFYYVATVESNLRARRSISSSTLSWWMGQSDEARSIFTNTASAISFEELIDRFVAYCNNVKPDYYWANGVLFDFAILENAIRQCDLEIPWRFNQLMDYRTLKNIVPIPKPLAEKFSVPHHALDDALCQALHLGCILQFLQSGAKGV